MTALANANIKVSIIYPYHEIIETWDNVWMIDQSTITAKPSASPILQVYMMCVLG